MQQHDSPGLRTPSHHALLYFLQMLQWTSVYHPHSSSLLNPHTFNSLFCIFLFYILVGLFYNINYMHVKKLHFAIVRSLNALVFQTIISLSPPPSCTLFSLSKNPYPHFLTRFSVPPLDLAITAPLSPAQGVSYCVQLTPTQRSCTPLWSALFTTTPQYGVTFSLRRTSPHVCYGCVRF